MRILFTVLLLGALSSGAFAQRPRTTESEPVKSADPAPTAPAPSNVKAKYEGGYFGYNKTMDGTLTFDDNNNRLVFKDGKTPKEISMPYESLTSVYSDTKKVQPAAATVASNVPSVYSLPARFIKTKVRYLTLQYSDPDSHVSGIMSFKIDDKQLLESVLVSLAQKSGMTKRGDIYVKKRDDSSKLEP